MLLNPKLNFSGAVCCLFVLSACGGGGGGPSGTGNGNPLPPFGESNDQALALIGEYLDTNRAPLNSVTRASEVQIPMTDEVQYEGQFSGQLQGEGLVGDIAMDINFDTTAVLARGTNFQHETQGTWAGTLTGTGDLQRSATAEQFQITTVIDGALQSNGGSIPVSLALDGNFFEYTGDAVGALAGPADGLADGDLVSGAFALQRQ